MAHKTRNISVIDCETDPFEYNVIPKPFIWGYYNGTPNGYYEFESISKFAEFIKSKNEIVYAHNGGKFDFMFLTDYFDSFLPISIINGRLVDIPFGKSNLRDSYAIIPVALAQFEKMKFDYSKLKKENRHKYMNEIREYLKSDCVNLYNLVKAFIDKYGTKITLASTAVEEVSRLENLKTDILHTNASHYKLANFAYYGGRVQAFQTGLINRITYIYDINSAYPFAMMHEHPIGEHAIIGKNQEINDTSLLLISGSSKGAFPSRNGALLNYPNTNSVYTCTGWEYKCALDTSTFTPKEILKIINFTEKINFKQFVEFYYKQKQQSVKNSTDYIFAKLMLNSFYGKLAANPDNYYDYIMIPAQFINASIKIDNYKLYTIIGEKALMYREISNQKKRWYNLATAASITGFVRAMLWRKISEVINHGCEIYYCDTDSIICNCPHIKIGNGIGEWKIEQTNDRLAIIAPKLYAAREYRSKKWKIASKGVELNAKEILSLAKGNNVQYHRDAPTFSIIKPTEFIHRTIKGLEIIQ